MCKEFEFKAGDKVRIKGTELVAVLIPNKNNDSYPFSFQVINDYYQFTKGGAYKWNLDIQLELVERPKQKVTKTLEGYITICPKKGFGVAEIHEIFRNEDIAYQCKGHKEIVVKVIGNYEIEE